MADRDADRVSHQQFLMKHKEKKIKSINYSICSCFSWLFGSSRVEGLLQYCIHESKYLYLM